jgi:hypothetical protein
MCRATCRNFLVTVRTPDVSPSWAGCAKELIEAVAHLILARRSTFESTGRCDLGGEHFDPKLRYVSDRNGLRIA